MKIAIIGSRGYPYVYGGFETFVKELSERLVKKNVQVIIYCQKNLFTEYPKEVNGIELVYIPTINTKSLNQLVHCFLSIIHATFSTADVLLAVNLAAGPMGWIPKLTGKKTMINVDGLEWLRPKWKGAGARYFYWAAKIAVRVFDRIITDAEAMRQVYLNEFKTDSTVIAYGAPAFKEQDTKALQSWGLVAGGYYLIVGRLIPDNNALLIIEGYLKSNSGKQLVIVGDVPYKDEYAERVKEMKSEKLIFTGYITDQNALLGLYQHCFAYLHGHKFGGTNPAMLKAMSNHCAIIALNTIFNREMLGEGKLGLFFEENILSISEVLTGLENDPVRAHHLKALVYSGLTEKYNWDAVTDKYINEASQLLTAR